MVEFPKMGFPTGPRLHIRTERARLDPSFRSAELEIDVERNGYQMKFTPAKLEIDNRPYFDSVNLKSIKALAEDYVRAAQQAARQAAERECRKGEAIANGASIGSLAYLQATRSIERMLVCVQPQMPEITCLEADLEVAYTKDQYTFTWDTGGAGASYEPYSIEMWVEYSGRITDEVE